MNRASIPVADYKALAPQFNPTKFSAEEIVGLAKSAGMKYIVITSKHHDGFAMFDSQANPFNIVQATPFKRDPLKELAAECRKQHIKLGFYYSQDQDWTAPGGAAYKTGDHQPPTYHCHWERSANATRGNPASAHNPASRDGYRSKCHPAHSGTLAMRIAGSSNNTARTSA